MLRPSEDEVRETYADLLGEGVDAATIRLIADLDAGLTGSEPPPELWSRIPGRRTPSPGPSPVAQERGSLVDMPARTERASLAGMVYPRGGGPPSWPSSHAPNPFTARATGGRPYAIRGGRTGGGTGRTAARLLRFRPTRLRWVHLPLAAGLLSLLTVGLVLAVSAITDLGPPTNALPPKPAPVLDGFARKGPALTHAGKPEVLFIGTEVSGDGSGTAVELWALVKALDQFGRFSGVGMAETQTCEGATAQTARCFSPNNFNRGYPILDLGHARYTSRYLSLVHKDLIDLRLHVHSNFSPVESSLIQTYVKRYATPPSSSWADFAWQESTQPRENHGLPLVSIGGYLRVDSGVAISGDLIPTISNIPLPFSAVQNSLQSGKAVGGAPYSLVPDINAEANVLTALTCHADGKKPAGVCNRSAIKTVLKHVK